MVWPFLVELYALDSYCCDMLPGLVLVCACYQGVLRLDLGYVLLLLALFVFLYRLPTWVTFIHEVEWGIQHPLQVVSFVSMAEGCFGGEMWLLCHQGSSYDASWYLYAFSPLFVGSDLWSAVTDMRAMYI